jgi:hypothetical protein
VLHAASPCETDFDFAIGRRDKRTTQLPISVQTSSKSLFRFPTPTHQQPHPRPRAEVDAWNVTHRLPERGTGTCVTNGAVPPQKQQLKAADLVLGGGGAQLLPHLSAERHRLPLASSAMTCADAIWRSA